MTTLAMMFTTRPPPAVFVDLAFTALVELGRRASGQRIVPLRVDFARPEAQGGPWERYFGCPIHYGADQDALIISAADLDLPFPGHNPEMLAILTPALAASLGELEAGSSVSEQIKVVVKRRIASGRPEISDIARELGVSERTLQRRVTDEGMTFRQLLSDARQELSHQLLGDPAVVVNTGAGRALLVDDEEVVRASTADMLAELGYDVVEAGSSEDALRLLDEGLSVDILITDHLMPGKSGTELARDFLKRLPASRVLVVSGYAEVEGVAPDLPRLVKPFRLAELAASLAEGTSP